MAILHEAKALLGRLLRPVHAGDGKLLSHQKEVEAAQATLTVESTAFSDGSPIPHRHASQAAGGQNLSPPLKIGGVPGQARSLAVIVEDPDAPFPNPFIHWVLYNLPPDATRLEEHVRLGHVPLADGPARQAKNSAKQLGYTGPTPPAGHGPHHYHFQVFALDTSLNLPESPSHKDLLRALEHHVLAFGETVGTFERF